MPYEILGGEFHWSVVNIIADVTKDGKTLDELRGNTE